MTLRTEIAVVEIAQIIGITNPGIVNPCVPVVTKMTIVFGADQPTGAVIIRKFVLVLTVVANPAAVEFLIANVLAQPAKLALM